jgi:hypothetical protein
LTQTLGNYDPIFYAQESLIQLEKALGMSGRVYRGYDKEQRQKGSVISIDRPTSFAATEVNPSTGGTTQELAPDTVNITLNQWWETKFALTDKELSFTQDQIIEKHIRPAAYSIADKIDLTLVALYKQIPWHDSIASTPTVADITKAYQKLFDLKAPVEDGNLHFMVDGAVQAGLQNIAAFHTVEGAGSAGTETQLRGTLGRKFGFEIFANQNTPAHLSGTMADTAGAVNADTAAGVTAVVVKSLTDGQTVKIGDILAITGDAQRYTITANATVSSATSISIYPALKQAAAENAVVTVYLPSGTGATKNQCLAFHRNAFALAMAPLPNIGEQLGARVASVVDPVTGLALRSRMWYDGDKSTVKVGIDALWGVQVLDPNLAVRMVQ